jgi:hypothetical protein
MVLSVLDKYFTKTILLAWCYSSYWKCCLLTCDLISHWCKKFCHTLKVTCVFESNILEFDLWGVDYFFGPCFKFHHRYKSHIFTFSECDGHSPLLIICLSDIAYMVGTNFLQHLWVQCPAENSHKYFSVIFIAVTHCGWMWQIQRMLTADWPGEQTQKWTVQHKSLC